MPIPPTPSDPYPPQGEPDYRDALPEGPAHRRGAGLNPGNRFENQRVHVLGEHLDRRSLERQWEGEDPRSGKPVRVPLEVIADKTQTIINRVQPTSDVPFDWTVNPYRGCEHGCIYCFARPYHEYLGFSAGLDFETKLIAKHDAPDLLKRELASPKWTGEPIVMSAITDIYQPIEKRYEFSRRCLEVMANSFQPVSTMTKGTLVLRDADLWQKLASRNAGRVIVTLVTLDDDLASKLEPRASPPRARLKIIRELTAAGVPVSVNVAPVIPGLTDHEVPAILEAVAEAGARRVAWVLLRLPYQVKDLFLDWLQRNVHPDRARKVESLIRQARGGKLYDAGRSRQGHKRIDDQTSRMVATRETASGHDNQAATLGFPDPDIIAKANRPSGERGRGTGEHAWQIRRVFDVMCRKHGLNRNIRPLSKKHFRRPNLHGQINLFSEA
ncbi:MAG: PA0069 family radical SAM protein [Planctomycetota bacterium]